MKTEYKIYNHIDNFPLHNYIQISETNDLRYLLVLPDYFELPEIDKKTDNKLNEIWENINDEIIEYTGIPNDFKEILKVKKAIALMKVKLMMTNDRSLETLIELKERELINIFPKQKQDINESIIALELILKLQIDIYKTSVKKYFSYISFLKKQK